MNVDELMAGCSAFWEYEGRDAIYRVAARLVEGSRASPRIVLRARAVSADRPEHVGAVPAGGEKIGRPQAVGEDQKGDVRHRARQ